MSKKLDLATPQILGNFSEKAQHPFFLSYHPVLLNCASTQGPLCHPCIWLTWKTLVAGSPQGWIIEKVPEAAPTSDRASTSKLQDRLSAGQR